MIDYIVTELGSDGALSSAIPFHDLGASWVDSEAVLDTLLQSLVSGRMYPLILPEDDKTHPSIVQAKVQSGTADLEGVPFYRSDVFVLTLRADSYSGLETLEDSVASAIDGYGSTTAAGVIQITDKSASVENDKTDPVYRLDMEVVVTHISIASQAIPLAVVSVAEVEADDDIGNGALSQTQYITVNVDILAASTAMEATRASVQSTLLGLQETEYHTPIVYAGGQAIIVNGHLQLWREMYQTSINIRG